jgi:hypothetical protein
MSKSQNKGANKVEAAATTNVVQKDVAPYMFGRTNYIIMGVGILMLIVGYYLMTGAGNDPNHPDVFNAAAKYNFTRITLSPIIIVAGLVVEIFAIMYKQKN